MSAARALSAGDRLRVIRPGCVDTGQLRSVIHIDRDARTFEVRTTAGVSTWWWQSLPRPELCWEHEDGSPICEGQPSARVVIPGRLLAESIIIRCACGYHRASQPDFAFCPQCQKDEHRAELRKFRARAIDAVPISLDHYSDALVAWVSPETAADADQVVRVRDAGIFMRMHLPAKRDELVADAMRLRDENRNLLVENATLRRQLERVKR